jgi:hypothetical protein
MAAERRTSLILLVLLIVLVFVYHIGLSIYFVVGLEPLPTFEFLYTAGFLCGAVWWLRADTLRSPVVSIYCHGLLVGIGWIIVIPYHLLKTRGVRGLIPLLALVGAYVISQIFAAAVYVAFS